MSNAPEFHAVPLAEVRAETPELVHLALNGVPAALREAYGTPGQYVQIREGDGKPGFFALASGPGREGFEFLIKRGPPLAEALAGKKAGQDLSISAPAGKGFPAAEAVGRALFLVGVGSGLAPLRAAAHAVLDGRLKPRAVRFYYGARRPDAIPYAAETKAWAAQGIEFHAICSQPPGGVWNGRTGRVQALLEECGAHVAPDACVFACGMKDMVADAKRILAAHGLPESRVFLNF
ncbi:MAG: hypothetical protein M5U26_09250 [Planctomycetota bacterium]|nr:hypothetical protein [Planctomycetota bacterium]